MLGKLAVCAVLAALASANEVKVGAVLHSTGTGSFGKKAYETWKTWVDAQTDLSYTVSLTVTDFTSDTLESVIGNFTTGAGKVDVLVLPYGSGNVITSLGYIDSAFTGPVMVWGGASDSIFASGGPCDAKSFKCFGFFTVGSQYMTSGLTSIASHSNTNLKVLLVENGNPFSHSVCNGAETTIGTLDKLELLGSRIVCAEKASVSDQELAMITGNASDADVVVVCGHHGFVEPVIKKIGETTTPKAIISTNSLTSGAIADIGDKANCVMMPTQWAEAEVQDTIVGWTSADFKTATGDAGTYHGASAGASAILISHAMAADPTVANLATTMAGLAEFTSFYGPVSFASNGVINKPMYTQQKQGAEIKIVAPVTPTTHHAKEAEMMFPLSSCDFWKSGNVTTTEPQAAVDGAARTSAVFGLVLALAMQYDAIE